MTGKKVVGSKNDISKSCPKFFKLGDNFFYFDNISKMRILQPENTFSEGWTYLKLVCGPIRNRFMDLLETGLWTYQKPVCGPIRNRFVDLSETSLWT